MHDFSTYLSAIGYAVGDGVALPDLNDPGIMEELASLRGEGMRECRVANCGRTSLAATAARQSLGDHARQMPGAVVYCTDTVSDSPTHEARRLLAEMGGLPDQFLMAGGSACANLGPGLRIAMSWLKVGQVESVLLVTSDEVIKGSRYLASGRTVLSDSAASCLVSTVPVGPSFRVLGMSFGGRAAPDSGSAGSHALRQTAAGVEQTVRAALGLAGSKTSDCRYILTGNLGRTLRGFLAMAAGFRPTKVYAPCGETLAHCFAADILIALRAIVADGLVNPGDLLMLLPTSPGSWSAIVVEYVPASSLRLSEAR